MKYSIEFKGAALRELRKLSQQAQRQIGPVIDSLADNPRPSGVVKMEDATTYRVRSGDYRILYTIEDAALIVLVVKIANRRDAYKR